MVRMNWTCPNIKQTHKEERTEASWETLMLSLDPAAQIAVIQLAEDDARAQELRTTV